MRKTSILSQLYSDRKRWLRLRYYSLHLFSFNTPILYYTESSKSFRTSKRMS